MENKPWNGIQLAYSKTLRSTESTHYRTDLRIVQWKTKIGLTKMYLEKRTFRINRKMKTETMSKAVSLNETDVQFIIDNGKEIISLMLGRDNISKEGEVES